MASPGKKKKRKRKQESQQEVAGNEHVAAWQGDRQRGSASPGSALPAVNGQRPEDRAGVQLGGGHTGGKEGSWGQVRGLTPTDLTPKALVRRGKELTFTPVKNLP